MPNPFDDQEALYLTLMNANAQYSIWPTFIDVPSGWEIVRSPASRAEVLAWIDVTEARTGSESASTAAETGP
jgi:MbtH protein